MSINTNDVETAHMVLKHRISRKKYCGGIDELALLSSVNRQHCMNEARMRPVTYFDKNQHCRVTHNDVNLTASASEIAIHRAETLRPQIAKRNLLGIQAY
jgi:hypothetical protein